MDQVGIEPTSSRLTGEVTLPYTTSNSFACAQPVRAINIFTPPPSSAAILAALLLSS